MVHVFRVSYGRDGLGSGLPVRRVTIIKLWLHSKTKFLLAKCEAEIYNFKRYEQRRQFIGWKCGEKTSSDIDLIQWGFDNNNNSTVHFIVSRQSVWVHQMSWVLFVEAAWVVLFEWFDTEPWQVRSYLAKHSPAHLYITALPVHKCRWCWCAHLRQDQNTWHNLGQQTHLWFSCCLSLCIMFLSRPCFSTHSAQSHARHGKVGCSLSNLFTPWLLQFALVWLFTG